MMLHITQGGRNYPRDRYKRHYGKLPCYHSPCTELCSLVLWIWLVCAALLLSPPTILFGGPSSETWDVNDTLEGAGGQCSMPLKALLSQPLYSQSWRYRSSPVEHRFATGHHLHCNKNEMNRWQKSIFITKNSNEEVGISNLPQNWWTWRGNWHSPSDRHTLAEHAKQSLSNSWFPGDWSSRDDTHK